MSASKQAVTIQVGSFLDLGYSILKQLTRTASIRLLCADRMHNFMPSLTRYTRLDLFLSRFTHSHTFCHTATPSILKSILNTGVVVAVVCCVEVRVSLSVGQKKTGNASLPPWRSSTSFLAGCEKSNAIRTWYLTDLKNGEQVS
jgi:hypothetical protein